MFCLIHFTKIDNDINLRYASIIAAAVFAWLTLLIEVVTAGSEGERIADILLNKRNGNCIRIAMLFTLLADYFMVALPTANNLAGVSVFLGTQLFVFFHIILNDESKKSRMANIICRLALTPIAVLVAFLILGSGANAMAIISVVYYANLLTNAIFAHRIGKGGIMLTVGLVLFALCDVNVGLQGLASIYSNGLDEGSLLYLLTNTSVDMIWVFYVPSQTLIPLSILYFEKSEKPKAAVK